MMKKMLLPIFLFFVVCGGNAVAAPALAISPNSDTVHVVVEERPTFRWSPAKGAVAYEVAVFESPGPGLPAYEEMEAMAGPLLSNEIAAPARSWTPSPAQFPGREGSYVWYVRRIDETGRGVWSGGKRFTVGAAALRALVKEDMEAPEVDVTGRDDGERVQRDDPYFTFFGYIAGTLTTGISNTFVGSWAGYKNTTGRYNTFLGENAGYNNSTQGYNTFVGYKAGYKNTSRYNTFVGNEAGYGNTTGYNNTFVGVRAGDSNKTGVENTFIGYKAGYNHGGHYNTFVGSWTGYENSTGDYNTFIGRHAGYKNNADGNTFVGDGAGRHNTSGDENTFLGYAAGNQNTEGQYNTLLGKWAGYNNTTANFNTLVGRSAGYTNSTGSYNTFLGESSGYSNTEGRFNTFIGKNAGYNNTTADGNTFVGRNAGFSNKSGENNVFIGLDAGHYETGSNKLYIDSANITSTPLIYGNFSTNKVVIYGGFRAIASYISSDERLKREVRPLESSLEKVSNLQGVSYEWKTDEYPDMGLTKGRHIGLIAQKVETVFPELVETDRDGYKSVSYSKLTSVLVEAVKELKVSNEEQHKEIAQQQRLIEAQQNLYERQRAEIEQLRALIKKL